MAKLTLFNKPYGVLCQFTDAAGRTTLKDYISTPGIYPAGRLDQDSEGLLLLTDDGALQHRIAHPAQKLPKTYWVQVEGEPSEESLAALRQGVTLKDGPTLPAQVEHLSQAPVLWPRQPPVRHREQIPTHWLAITLTEGRNRQVRRMTAAIGHPTLRLVRVAIGPWQLEALSPGEQRTETVHLPASAAPNRGTKPAKPRHASHNSRRSP